MRRRIAVITARATHPNSAIYYTEYPKPLSGMTPMLWSTQTYTTTGRTIIC